MFLGEFKYIKKEKKVVTTNDFKCSSDECDESDKK